MANSEISVFAPILESRFIFLGKACAEMGVSVRLITLAANEFKDDDDAIDCKKWLRLNPFFYVNEVSPHELESFSGEKCFVFLRGNYGRSERELVRRFVKRFSRSIGLLRFASNSLRWQAKQVFKEIKDPYFRLFTEIWTEDLDIRFIRLALNKPHHYFGALPHQRCSVISECWDRLGSEVKMGERRHLFAWAGSANHKREPIANLIEQKLERNDEIINLGPIPRAHRVIWHYDRPGGQRPRPYNAYLEQIESAWFCLCLPGYTGTTNRALEAVLRGAIPVIQQELVKYHCLPLVDRVNSVFVVNGNWEEALVYIASLPKHICLEMQQQVIQTGRSQASLKAMARRLVRNIQGT
jgi:hypothetical protein